MFGSGAMTNSIGELQDARVLFVIGSNTTEAHPVIASFMKRARRNGSRLIVCDPRRIDLVRWASHHIQHKVGTDVALLNGLMNEILRNGWEDKGFIAERTEGFDDLVEVVREYPLEKVSQITSVGTSSLREVARILAAEGPVSLCYTLGITEHTTGTDNVKSCANLQLLLGNLGKSAAGVNPLRGQNNVQGACDMGALPNVYHNYQKVDDPAVQSKFEAAWGRLDLSARPGYKLPTMLNGMLDGRTRALVCLGENIVMSEPNMAHTINCLEQLEFLVVAEIFLSETAEYADVVLPCRSWGEKDGTFTNTERRVQRVRAAVNPSPSVREAWWIFNEIGKRMGFDMGFTGTAGIWEEMRSLSTLYAGITWERVEEVGLQWPVPSLDHPGTPYLHPDGRFSRGKAKFWPARYRAPAEEPDTVYPLFLSTGRRLWHYHTGTQTRNCVGFESLFPEELLEISSVDAERLEVSTGDWVDVISRRGKVRMKAWVTERSPVGLVWSSFHFREACINQVTNNVFDPVTETAEYKVCAVRVEKVAPAG
jgi:predicted molibdopterin-dependent oxidoreductase YjgC